MLKLSSRPTRKAADVPRIPRWFIDGWKDLSRHFTFSEEFASLIIRTQDLDLVDKIIDWRTYSEEATTLLHTLIVPEVIKAGQAAFDEVILAKDTITGLFEVKDKKVVEYIESRSMSTLTLSQTKRKQLKAALKSIYKGGMGPTHPVSVARMQKALSTIDLPDRYQRALDNFGSALTRKTYEDRYPQLIPKNAGGTHPDAPEWGWQMLPEQERARTAAIRQAYEDRLRQSHARTVARTETLTAQNQGRWNGWQQLADEGVIDKDHMVKVWLTAPGACTRCANMAGTAIHIDALYTEGEGMFTTTQTNMPPLHPNCRCTAVLQPGEPPPVPSEELPVEELPELQGEELGDIGDQRAGNPDNFPEGEAGPDAGLLTDEYGFEDAAALKDQTAEALRAALRERPEFMEWWNDPRSDYLHVTMTEFDDPLYAYVNNIVSQWAQTSGDMNAASVMMQHAARLEFGLDTSAVDHMLGMTGVGTQVQAWEMRGLRMTIRSMYDLSQRELERKGITSLQLVRGTSETVIEGEVHSMQPMSSFTTSKWIADQFAGSSGGGIVYAEVPAEWVVSFPGTGYGCLGEQEVVVLARAPLKVSYRSSEELFGTP